jgi:D-ribose pyranose/furanose isomerase RbsD
MEIPASVEVIDFGAVWGCSQLTEVIFAAGSRLRKINGFVKCTSLSRIEIPASVEVIDFGAVGGCSELTEVIVASGSRLRRINGFDKCTSLSRIEIPASVEEIDFYAFQGCSRLTEVIMATDGSLKRISGFGKCESLFRLEIPASVERIGSREDKPGRPSGFLGDMSRRELIVRSGTHLRPNAKEDCFRGFVIFEDENDLKRRRRQAHSGVGA